MKMHTGAADLLAQQAYREGRPITVTFQVTDRCNYECVHCFQQHTKNPELTTEEIERILGELAEAGVLFLTLMGGELFMRRDADRIIEVAHNLGFALKILTTGHHVHDRRADFLATMRPLQVDMSMYGATPHTHEQVTRHPGSWKRTYEAARRLLARRIPVLLKAPVMESNVGDLVELKRLAQEMGAESSFDAKITGMETGDQEPVGLRMRWTTLKAFYKTEETGVAGFLAKSYADHDPETSELRPLHHTPCRAGQQAASINPQGEVWPCNSLPIKCGDLRAQSFQEIWWGSDDLRDIRDLRWAKIDECNRCELRAYCQRCHAMAMLEQGELRGPSLEACRHAVAVRDSLRERGLIPQSETALPPTWDRIDLDGQHHDPRPDDGACRPAALKVLP